MIEIVSPGLFATVQDLGRPGLAALGVGESGAADAGSLARANHLAGNPAEAAGLELTFGGLVARFSEPATVALAGAPCPVSVDGVGAGMDAVIELAAGAELRVGRPSLGLRTYLAVRGGIAVPLVLGSRSTDVLAGLGPAVLVKGAVLPVGAALPVGATVDTSALGATEAAGARHRPAPAGARDEAAPWPDVPVLTLVAGPRDDWFTEDALRRLVAEPYLCTTESNRVGMRLSGLDLPRRRTGELPSEGMVRGSLQVPPSGQPILFLADHPVTGGYPVIAVVAGGDLDSAAQVRPGQSVRFELVGAP